MAFATRAHTKAHVFTALAKAAERRVGAPTAQSLANTAWGIREGAPALVRMHGASGGGRGAYRYADGDFPAAAIRLEGATVLGQHGIGVCDDKLLGFAPAFF